MASKDQNPANFSFFKVLQGLKHNNISCMLQDKTGNLWFGTDGGVCRYDGKSFTNFTDKEGLANNVVFSILEDKTGNLWFGTGGGVCRYDGNCVDDIINETHLYQHNQHDLKKNKKDLVKSFTNFTEKEGLSNNFVFSILEDKTGNLWFGTYGGVCRYDGKSFTNFTDKEGLANNYVLSILEDKTGNLWFGTNGGGVSRYDGKSFTNFTDKEGLANNVVLNLLQDKEGNIWFGTKGLSRIANTSFS
jgi:ligand-binding sensor domain-containing protein